MGELHAVRVSMGLQTSTYNNKAEISDRSSQYVIEWTLSTNLESISHISSKHRH